MVFTKETVEGKWKWGEQDLPMVSNYTYLGIEFTNNGAWDKHIKKVVDSGTKKLNQVHSFVSNLSVVRPTLEYGSEVWEGNKTQAASLESVVLDGAKCIL